METRKWNYTIQWQAISFSKLNLHDPSLITTLCPRTFLCHAKYVFWHICAKARQLNHTENTESSNYKVKCMTLKTHHGAVCNLKKHAIQRGIIA